MRLQATLFYDVDTQQDFIHADGALAVPGAERILPQLAALTALARQVGIRLAGSVDRHFPGDPELARNGGAYPDHCMDGTPGQRKVAATAPRAPIWIENRRYERRDLEVMLSRPGEVIIEKQQFDVFAGNQNAEAVFDALLRDVADVVVYGVATEICVDRAIAGLRRRGVRLYVPADGIAGLDAGAVAETTQRWRRWGVVLTTTAGLTRELAR